MSNWIMFFDEEEIKKLLELNMYERAKIIVDRLFKNVVDKAGEPYVNHLYRVSNRLECIDEKIIGLLHDIIEDTIITAKDLIDMGFKKDIVDCIELLTKDNKSTYKSLEDKLIGYNKKIDKIIESKNISALRVKKADISDNYDLDRIQILDIDMQMWFEKKYKNNLIKLKDAERKIL